MRVIQNRSYPEQRDALAHDWSAFMQGALPECVWLPIPNMGASAVSYFDAWELEGLMLTGGNDPSSGVRATTEAALLEMALRRNIPVFGVCRGLQELQVHFGGPLAPCSEEVHVGRRHRVAFPKTAAALGIERTDREVNSFHHWGIPQDALAPPMRVCALSADGGVEAAYCEIQRVAGVMWHPERERPIHAQDIAFVRLLFGLSQHNGTRVGL